MVNPETITNYDLDDRGLEEHILFWICAAGKNGRTAARCLDTLLRHMNAYEIGPFNAIKIWGYWEHPETQEGWPELLRDCGIGCYNTKSKAMFGIATSGLDLRTCSASDLESVHGIGLKTSRCFIMHSRKDSQVAGLDTHMLKNLRALGYDAPKSTPTGKKYLDMEQIVLILSKEAGMTPAEFDLQTWLKYSVPSKPKS